MKKLIVLALVAMAGVCSSSRGSAQERKIQGRIPFDFRAGSTTIAAGSYRITYDVSGLLRFRNLDTGKTVMMFGEADQTVDDGTCNLVFSRHGDQYLLKQAACSKANVNFFIPTSPQQKRAEEQAMDNDGGRLTLVALN